jgi:hypothetical protein
MDGSSSPSSDGFAVEPQSGACPIGTHENCDFPTQRSVLSPSDAQGTTYND